MHEGQKRLRAMKDLSMQKKVDNNQEKDNTMNNSTLAPQAETESNVTGDVTENEGEKEVQNEVVAYSEKEMYDRYLAERADMYEQGINEYKFRSNLHDKAFEMCQSALTFMYGSEYSKLLTDAYNAVHILSEKRYSEYVDSDEYDCDFPEILSSFREDIIMRGYHLYREGTNDLDDSPKEYSELCDAIREASHWLEVNEPGGTDHPFGSPVLSSMVDYLQRKLEGDDDFLYGGELRSESNIVVAHLLQMWKFCDIMEYLPEQMFFRYSEDDEQ